MLRRMGFTLPLFLALCPSRVSAQPGKAMIVVPVVVRDQSGAEVTDLTMNSFELQDKGKPQRISNFELIKRGADGRDGKPVERYTAYLIDDIPLNELGDFKVLIDAAKLQMAKTAQDEHVAIYTTSCAAALTAWTNDAARLQQFLEGLLPYTSSVGVCTVSTTETIHLSLIKALIGRMAALPGLRNIVIVSPGYRYFRDTRAQQASVIELANQSQVIISAVAVSYIRLSPGFVDPVVTDGLIELAENTGGSAATKGKDLKLPDSVYLLTLSLANVKADGAVHQLKVIIKDPRKLTVRARKNYTAPKV